MKRKKNILCCADHLSTSGPAFLNTLNIQNQNANFPFDISYSINFILKRPEFSFGVLDVFARASVDRGPLVAI